jgi:cob(I)alamin adenosyltransferase
MTAGRRRPPTEPPQKAAAVHAPSTLIVNTGTGKGKTTAAMGTAIRAVARGWKVCVIQFIKSGRWRTGEEKVARELGVSWLSAGDGFTWESEDLKTSEALATRAWEQARETLAAGDYDLVILDEVTYPMVWGWVSIEEVVRSLQGRPGHVNVIATGRDAPSELIAEADTVTEMRNVRHAFDRGVQARRGIDY